MASPYRNANCINLQAADSPFNNLITGPFRLLCVVVTPAAAITTLTLYNSLGTSDATTIIGQYIAPASGASLVIPFGIIPETPYLTVGISATLSGAGGQAFIYYS